MVKPSEGAVALALLTVLALWLFVGLPFLYLPLRDSVASQTVAMSSPNWLVALLGFFGGSMATFLATKAYEYVMRPVISAELLNGKGCYVTTSRGNPATHEARFLRLLIENKGRSPIKNCTGYVTRITKTVDNRTQDMQQEVLELNWSHGDTSPRSIPRGAFFYMDIASLDLLPAGRVLGLGAPLPNHVAPLMLTGGTFELEIKIAAENASPVDRNIRFTFGPLLNDLVFNFDEQRNLG